MEKRGGSEELIEFAEAGSGAGDDIGAGNVLHSGKQVWNGLITSRRRGTIDNFVGVFDSKSNRIAVLQLPAFDFLTVHKQAAALTAIFNVMFVGLHHDGGTVSRNATIGELQVIAGFGAAADQEWALRDAHKTTSAVWRNDLQHSFGHNGYGVRHTSYVS